MKQGKESESYKVGVVWKEANQNIPVVESFSEEGTFA